MPKSRFAEAQIVAVLKELDAGRPVADLARCHGVHANTIRLWKDRYGGLIGAADDWRVDGGDQQNLPSAAPHGLRTHGAL